MTFVADAAEPTATVVATLLAAALARALGRALVARGGGELADAVEASIRRAGAPVVARGWHCGAGAVSERDIAAATCVVASDARGGGHGRCGDAKQDHDDEERLR